ncbi:MAG: 50S ribosomal protein L29 [Thermodesulfobacteriota bacterium]
MKNKKASELRDLSAEELVLRQRELQTSLFNLRFQHGTNQLENTMGLKQTKREIARVLTVLNEKRRNQAGQ